MEKVGRYDSLVYNKTEGNILNGNKGIVNEAHKDKYIYRMMSVIHIFTPIEMANWEIKYFI